MTISKKELRINEEIKGTEFRIIDNDGNAMGIMTLRDALAAAMNAGFDLVEIAPQGTPPVCRIMDYGKHKFEQAKRDKEAKKNQKVTELKEIRLSLNIDTHDLETKKNHAKKFLEDADKVKVSIRFRGREMAHSILGIDVMKRFAEELSEVSVVEKQPKLEGRTMLMFLAPKPNR